MKTYNQNLEELSKMGCSLYGIYHIIYLKYWIKVNNNFILSSLLFFEKLWVWSRISWASFAKIYKSFENEVNKKLKINIKIVTKSILDITEDDKWSYWIWMPNYKNFKKFILDWSFDIEDIKNFLSSWVWHHLVWDWWLGWYLVNSNWEKPIKCSLKVLKEMVKQGIVWNNFRTIEPATRLTENILALTVELSKAERRWNLEIYVEENKNNLYIQRAKELYFYWR